MFGRERREAICISQSRSVVSGGPPPSPSAPPPSFPSALFSLCSLSLVPISGVEKKEGEDEGGGRDGDAILISDSRFFHVSLRPSLSRSTPHFCARPCSTTYVLKRRRPRARRRVKNTFQGQLCKVGRNNICLVERGGESVSPHTGLNF